MISAEDRWVIEEEEYLTNLSRLCQDVSGRYKHYYDIYKVIQARFRIPSIVVSSVTGLTSFGSSNFPPAYREWVSIAVGIASLSIAILNSIETYMKIGENLASASHASIELHKLKEYIDMELTLPRDKRLTQGIIFLRDCYTRYERILEIAPDILKTTRFVHPSFEETTSIPVYASASVSKTSSRIKSILSLSSFASHGTPIILSPVRSPSPRGEGAGADAVVDPSEVAVNKLEEGQVPPMHCSGKIPLFISSVFAKKS